MYRYETHCHTTPASKCAKASPEETLRFYKSLGYDGVFITNHFLDGNTGVDRSLPYARQIELYFADYEQAASLSAEVGIKVFPGVELTYGGTDFLIYGLDKQWYLDHPEIMDMPKSRELPYLAQAGAFVAQAHPFREDYYIDHIRLYSKEVEAIEVINANRKERENRLAECYAELFGFLKIAGSDNHVAFAQKHLAGMESETPLSSVEDFIRRVRAGEMSIFTLEL